MMQRTSPVPPPSHVWGAMDVGVHVILSFNQTKFFRMMKLSSPNISGK